MSFVWVQGYSAVEKAMYSHKFLGWLVAVKGTSVLACYYFVAV